MELEGRIALVTGAARRLGRAIALALARRGCRPVIHYRRSRDAAQATAAEIEALGVEAATLPADLARPEEIARLFAEIGRRFGALDLLVNSAASFERQAFSEVTSTDWDAVLAVNLRAPFLCSRHAARWMAAGSRPDGCPGLIVNLADLSGVEVWPGYVQHGVSKAGLLHLTRVAARELAPGVRVNAIVPGPILPPPGMEESSPEWRRTGEGLPVGRVGDPAHVGQTVVFLAENDFVTGEAIFVDGGEHLLAGRAGGGAVEQPGKEGAT